MKGKFFKNFSAGLFVFLGLLICCYNNVERYNYKRIILIDTSDASKFAAKILAKKLGIHSDSIFCIPEYKNIHRGDILLITNSNEGFQYGRYIKHIKKKLKYDGYGTLRKNRGILVCGKRPRSLLYAAGDMEKWINRDKFVRNPEFKTRIAVFHGRMSVPEFIAYMKVNMVVGGPGATVTFKNTMPEIFNSLEEDVKNSLVNSSIEKEKKSKEFANILHECDVEYIAPFSYGCDFKRWSLPLYEATIKLYPSVEGKSKERSFEKGTICPSDSMTWVVVKNYIKEYIEKTDADGLIVSFWDSYGLYCQCERCKEDGLNEFRNELYVAVKNYYDVLSSLGKKLIVRTWSSGVPHWLRGEWVHAPGYGHFGGEGYELWGRVFEELPREIIIQTKIYHSDCQPNARFSELLGKAKNHIQIAEYQMTGQTQGRFYFPTSMVNYIKWTMKESLKRVSAEGGVYIHPGATRQRNYSLFDDILNSINVYVWKELTWDIDSDLNDLWRKWATDIYGERGGKFIIEALKLSEEAINLTFSPLGFGTETNSDFSNSINRKEVVIMYTNRYYLSEFSKYLLPTIENINLVVQEKNKALKLIKNMYDYLRIAKPFIRNDYYKEIKTRFDWFREFAICRKYIDESYWRFRYLRCLNSMRTTDPEQIKFIAQAYDSIKIHKDKLFLYDDNFKFSCYDALFGELNRPPSLGNPIYLISELYIRSLQLVEEIVGHDYIPDEWIRNVQYDHSFGNLNKRR